MCLKNKSCSGKSYVQKTIFKTRGQKDKTDILDKHQKGGNCGFISMSTNKMTTSMGPISQRVKIDLNCESFFIDWQGVMS